MNQQYEWHGEAVKVVFGSCVVRTNKDKPLWWYNYECETRGDFGSVLGIAIFPAIKVLIDNKPFVISNHFGIGVNKLLKGGWTDQTSFSLPLSSFSTTPKLKITVFDEESFAFHECCREKWQKENYPDEYSKMMKMKRFFQKRYR